MARASSPRGNGRNLAAREVPGAQAASIVHAWASEALGQWIEANRYHIAGPLREVYLQPPGETGGPVTEIQWPVEKQREGFPFCGAAV